MAERRYARHFAVAARTIEAVGVENNMDAKLLEYRENMPRYSYSHKLLRIVWRFSWWLLASWTPPELRSWRVFLLRMFGARIGKNTDVRNSASVWYPPNLMIGDSSLIGPHVDIYNMDKIEIGAGCIISQHATLCGGTHEIDDVRFRLITRPIVIGNNCWIASRAFIGPGVTVGEGTVLGAAAVAFKNLDPWTVYIGNPATALRQRKKLF
jgi:putative colanic acid biosynthesis acetyltransferase WcaF